MIKTAPHGKAKTLNPALVYLGAGGGQRRFCSTMSLKARGTSSVNTKKLDPNYISGFIARRGVFL